MVNVMRNLNRTALVWIHLLGCVLGVLLTLYGFGVWKDTGFKFEPKYSTEKEGVGAAFLVLLGITLAVRCFFSPTISRWLYPSEDDKRDDDPA